MCSPTNVGKVGQIATFFLAANIIIFITAFLNNSLILVAINKESSLHSPSKLLYCCLATSNLLVGLVIQPLCYLLLFRVLMLTMAAISADRLLALSLGLRYRQIVTLKCMYIITAIFQIASILVSLFYTSGIPLLYKKIVILSFSAISFTSYTKILRTLTRNQA